MERTVKPQIIQALNEMLEEERAAVEAVIGLTSMATDPHEREHLQRIGADEAWSCSGLRERIEAMGGPVSRHISPFASHVLGLEYFPERLRTYGRHQRLVMERISALLSIRTLDEETQRFLETMLAQHMQDVLWCEQRATEFEASRFANDPSRAAAQATPATPAPAAPDAGAIVERPRRVRRRVDPDLEARNGNLD